MEKYVVPTGTKIWHVHLKVSDLKKSLEFYCELLGFEKIAQYWDKAAFVSAGWYHHHIGLNTWLSKWMQSAQQYWVGLYHFALLYPTRKDLAKIFDRLLKADYEISWASDHWVSQALYLEDPDWNGLELYWDRPENEWPRDEKWKVDMYTKALDLDNLLYELN